mmetsp:Transcript_6593/g.9622  ORF Transcript_6593/g.9622 Transcript_6593/m.9622 type:complete len:353 (-) Transcript_6593:170-1228(-)
MHHGTTCGTNRLVGTGVRMWGWIQRCAGHVRVRSECTDHSWVRLCLGLTVLLLLLRLLTVLLLLLLWLTELLLLLWLTILWLPVRRLLLLRLTVLLLWLPVLRLLIELLLLLRLAVLWRAREHTLVTCAAHSSIVVHDRRAIRSISVREAGSASRIDVTPDWSLRHAHGILFLLRLPLEVELLCDAFQVIAHHKLFCVGDCELLQDSWIHCAVCINQRSLYKRFLVLCSEHALNFLELGDIHARRAIYQRRHRLQQTFGAMFGGGNLFDTGDQCLAEQFQNAVRSDGVVATNQVLALDLCFLLFLFGLVEQRSNLTLEALAFVLDFVVHQLNSLHGHLELSFEFGLTESAED